MTSHKRGLKPLDGIICPTTQQIQVCQMQNNQCLPIGGAEVSASTMVVLLHTAADGIVQDNGDTDRRPAGRGCRCQCIQPSAPEQANSFHLYQTSESASTSDHRQL
ncbi:MAG: hypothetical protein R2911_43445 [Caldilineaceae bacterium]